MAWARVEVAEVTSGWMADVSESRGTAPAGRLSIEPAENRAKADAQGLA